MDPNTYNVESLSLATSLWRVSVQQDRNGLRAAGVPFMDSASKTHFVADETFVVSRGSGGLGMSLLEIAGGREDGVGMTVVESVVAGGPAERAGLLPGDSLSEIGPAPRKGGGGGGRATPCECRDFDKTLEALAAFPPEGGDLQLGVKRLRRWPVVDLTVHYPPSQCAPGVDPTRRLSLNAGENLQRALQARGIVLDDPGQRKCDFCGKPACYIR